MSVNYSAIPKGVRELLRHKWRMPGNASIFDDNAHGARLADPSYYFARPGGDPPHALDYEDVQGLIAEPMFEGLARQGNGVTSMNEHAEHALIEFCEAVYEAWVKCEKRLESLPRRPDF